MTSLATLRPRAKPTRIRGSTHAALRERLLEYSEERLEPASRAPLRAHLRHCRACRAFAHTYRRTVALLRGLPRVAAPAAALARLPHGPAAGAIRA